ncbi:cytochrome P450 [Comamonadaceae bacterium G21597-S1]|nr:cytochrome P450 [Comamonadaceae bacterium G21597-S1]
MTHHTQTRDQDTTATPLAFPVARQCPYHPPSAYTELQDRSGLRQVRLWDGQVAWLVTRYADFRAVLKDRRFSADTRHPNFPNPNPGMQIARGKYRAFVSMDEPEHNRHRRMLTAEFSRKRIETLRPCIQTIIDELVTDLLAGPRPVDFMRCVALPFPSQVICLMLGVPYEAHDFFQERAAVLVSTTSTLEEAALASHELIDVYLSDLIDQKIAQPQDDIISRLVVGPLAHDDLDKGELLAMTRLLLVAGHETTANTITLSILTLLRHPEQLAALRENPSLLPQAVSELLRYLDPTQGGRRRVASEDVMIGGQWIRAGEAVVALNHVADRDAAQFPDPHRFDIHRAPSYHLAFGDGIHQCLGQVLAQVEIEMALATVLRRIPSLRLAVPLEELEFLDERVVYGMRAMPITW